MLVRGRLCALWFPSAFWGVDSFWFFGYQLKCFQSPYIVLKNAGELAISLHSFQKNQGLDFRNFPGWKVFISAPFVGGEKKKSKLI